MNRERTEDLKAFELRLTECVSHVRKRTFLWRVLLVFVCLITAYAFWDLWADEVDHENYWDMLVSHKSLGACLVVLFLLYIYGILERNNAPHLITSRCRGVLQIYNMSCDDQGKLILKRRES